MKRRRKEDNNQGGAPKWMVTFSDLMTLILVFFILLFSMSQINLIKFQAVAESFQNRLIFDFYPSVIPHENPTEDELKRKEETNKEEQNDLSDNQSEQQSDMLGQLLNEIEVYLEEQGLHNVITATRNERGVVLVLQEKVLFETAEAEIIQEAEPFLNKVGSLLHTIPNPVKVEGHTDNRPISTYRYPSNWELSGARASSVIRFLIDNNQLDPRRFTAIGFGDTHPIVPNNSSSNWQKNRRVEIVISDPAYSEVKNDNL